MLVLPKRELNDTFWAEALVIPEVRHIFEITTDQDPKEVEGVCAFVNQTSSLLSVTEVVTVNNGRETSFILPAFFKISEKLDIRGGSYYV